MGETFISGWVTLVWLHKYQYGPIPVLTRLGVYLGLYRTEQVHISDCIANIKFSYADTLPCFFSLLRVVKVVSSFNR